MPTIQSILESENRKPANCVLLFEEGLFLKAYEASAFLLWHRFHFKPTLRMVKCVRRQVVSVGFPTSVLGKYFPGTELKEGRAQSTMPNHCTSDMLEQWKATLLPSNGSDSQTPVSSAPNTTAAEAILGALRAFTVEKCSPLECMDFLVALKSQL